ncbi:MCE family protein [Nocardioides ultimimeridianus]
MRGLLPPLLKSAVFVVVTTIATLGLAFTIQNGGSGTGSTYHALFTAAPSLNAGDDVRMAGVRVGQVTDVAIANRDQALVTFKVDAGVDLTSDVGAEIRFRNLLGQRYVSLDQGTATGGLLAAGSTIPLERTRPALDLTQLFNGFQPLFRMLSPQDVNELSGQIISVFQGEGTTVSSLIAHTAGLTSTLAAKDRIIGEVIDNLNRVLGTVSRNGAGLSSLVGSLQRLVTGLNQDRSTITSGIAGIGAMTTSVGGLLRQARLPIRSTVVDLDRLAGNLAAARGTLNRTLTNLPLKLERLGRTVSYGSWVNFYLCSVGGDIPAVQGYLGGLGVDAVAGRCH